MSDYLSEVGRGLRLAVERHHRERGSLPRGRRVVRIRPLVAVVLLVLVLAAAAVAATLVLRVGSPVAPAGNASPTVGIGIPAPGGSRLLVIRAPDPAGGPPWGMRVLRTTRGLLCVQIGRVYQGRLGLLGIDGAFSDDGSFHPLGAAALGSGGPGSLIDGEAGISGPGTSTELCAPPGATFTAYASGLAPSGEMVKNGDALPSSERRWISFGLLGAHADAIDYRTSGRNAADAVLQPLGAYLIVLPGSAPGGQGGESGSAFGQGQISTPRPGPTGAVTAITYRFGARTCADASRAGTANSCPAPNSPAPANPTRDLHEPIRVRFVPHSGGAHALVTFVAPYAVSSALSGYTIEEPTPCHSGTIVTQVDRDVARGARVQADAGDLFANACGTTATVRVLYRAGTPSAPLTVRTVVVVGTVTVKRPR